MEQLLVLCEGCAFPLCESAETLQKVFLLNLDDNEQVSEESVHRIQSFLGGMNTQHTKASTQSES